MERNAEETKEFAEKLVRGTASIPAQLSRPDSVNLCWALKDFAVLVWASHPPDVAKASDLLDQIAAGTEFRDDTQAVEVAAIAAWVRGLSALTIGEASQAIDFLDSASTKFLSVAQSVNAAHTQSAKMMALSQIGKDDVAIETGLKALGILADAHEDHAAAKISLNLGNLYWNRGNYDDSLACYERSHAIFEQLGQTNLTAAANLGRTNALMTLGRFDEATVHYEATKDACKRHSLFAIEAIVIEWIAAMELARGRYSQAMRDLEAARQRYEALGLSQNLALAERQLGDVYLEIGLTTEAIRLFELALQRFEALSMQTELGWTYLQLASAAAFIDQRSDRIDSSLAKAKDIFDQQQTVPGLAAIALAAARIAHARGDYSSALEHANAASTIYAQIESIAQQLHADVVRAKAMLPLNRVAEADELLALALETSRSKGLAGIEIACHEVLGDIAFDRGQREVARRHFEDAVARSERLRGTMSSDRIRSAFLDDRLRSYKQLIKLSLDEYETNASQQSALNILTAVERLRARSLSERLGTSRETETGAQHAGAQTLRTRLNWIRRRLQRSEDEGNYDAALANEASRLEHELLEQLRRLEISTVRDAETHEDDTVDFAPFTKLGRNVVFIEYAVIDDELLAIVIRSAAVSIHRSIAPWQVVLESISALHFQLETMRYGDAVRAREAHLISRANRVLGTLRSQLWNPLQIALDEIDHVVISPTGALAGVPFCALYDSSARRYLVEQATISYVASARVASQLLRGKATDSAGVLAIAETTRLRHAINEVALVQAAFPQTQTLIGDEATAQNLRASSAGVGLLHCACHASFRSDNPSFSALQLADGTFTAMDAESLQLNAATVVLSGCETAIAELTSGDEMFGLVRGFMVGGAASIVASLWAIDDEATAAFMSHFYVALKETKSATQALAQAQHALLQANAHPFYWAAFAAYGPT